MTAHSKENIKQFWSFMAEQDLGETVHPVAVEISTFFNSLMDCEATDLWGDKWIHTDALSNRGKMAAYIRGFQMETGYGADDGLNISLCLDLHSVSMTEDIADEFQRWMLGQTAYRGDMFNWLYRYQANHPTKKPRKRRNCRTA